MLARWRNASMRVRLLVQLSVTFGIILAAFFFISIQEINTSTQQALEERRMIAQLMAERVDSQMSYAQSVLASAAADPDLDLEDGNLEPEKKLLQSVYEHSALFKRIYLLNSSGIVLWLAPFDADANRWLGVNVMAPPYGGPFDGASKPFFYEEMLGVRTQTPGIVIVIPILSPQGGISGYISGRIDMGDPRASPLYFPYKFQSATVADLVNEKGMILVSTNPDRIGQISDHNGFLGTLIQNKQTAVGSCHSCHATPGAERQNDVLAFAPLSRISWGVALRQPESEVLAPTYSLTLGLGGTAFLIVIALFGLIWATTNDVISPLRSLAQACQHIAAGDLSHPVPLKGIAETLVLAKSFENMRVALSDYREREKTYQHDLERRVEERTAELVRYRDYLLRSNRNLTALNAVSSILSHSLELTETLNIALERMIKTMGADAGGIFLIDQPDDALVLAAHRGLSAAAVSSIGRLPCTESLLAPSTEHSPIDDAAKQTACRKMLEERLSFGSLLCVPLEAKGENLGSIFLANHKQEFFSSEDEALFVSIGWQVAMAVRNARLYEMVQWKEKEHAEILHQVIVAQEEERKRIARELHDETSQALAALMLGLDTIGAAITHDPREAAIHQESAKAIAKGLLEDIRRITTDLRPSLLDDLGLIAAVTWYGEERLTPFGVALHLDADGLGDRRLPSDIEIALFRIIQEAITNIVRYAHASRVDIRLERQNGLITLQVSDDGQGFDPALSQASNLQGRGLGLRGMQERVSILGGEFHLQTHVGEGTTISVRVPVLEERSSRV